MKDYALWFLILGTTWVLINQCDSRARLFFRADMLLWRESLVWLWQNLYDIARTIVRRHKRGVLPGDMANWLIWELAWVAWNFFVCRTARKAELQRWAAEVTE